MSKKKKEHQSWKQLPYPHTIPAHDLSFTLQLVKITPLTYTVDIRARDLNKI